MNLRESRRPLYDDCTRLKITLAVDERNVSVDISQRSKATIRALTFPRRIRLTIRRLRSVWAPF